MSAWIVENGHIDILVNALAQFGIVPRDLGTDGYRALGQKLWHENRLSVNNRYKEDTTTPRYRLHTTEADLDPIFVLKAVACYSYQSCEHPGWEASEAYALIRQLHDAILNQNPEFAELVPSQFGDCHRYRTLPAYEQAPWGFEYIDQAVVANATSGADGVRAVLIQARRRDLAR